MNDNTINNDMTMGGAAATLLAGRYRVVRPLGQGGMGSVWLAEDTKLDGFQVAIKMLPSVLVNNKRAYAQVKAEALVSLKLSHPNIATVRAFEEESGSPFLVMDYIDGQTLDDYLAEKGKLSEEETVRLLKPVAAALDYAHGQGVVHRDVKPGNVMIRKDGTPFVLDFGIAREIQETMTRVTGKLSSGTLLYMSPEQLHGAAPKPAQDIYSFAAMAYECLTGRPPFERGQIEYQIEHDTPEPLPRHIAICRGIMVGLEKMPEVRPATCAVVLRPAHFSEGAIKQRSISRQVSRKVIFVACGVALALLGGFGFLCLHRRPERKMVLSKVSWSYEKKDAKKSDDLEHVNIPPNDAIVKLDKLAKEQSWVKVYGCAKEHEDNPVSQFYLGVCYDHGLGVEKQDLYMAAKYYRKAAHSRCAEALFNLGTMYEFGDAVEKDLMLAAFCYLQALRMGDVHAGERWRHLRSKCKCFESTLPDPFVPKPWPNKTVLYEGSTFVLMEDATGQRWDVPDCRKDDFMAAKGEGARRIYIYRGRDARGEHVYYVPEDDLGHFELLAKNESLEIFLMCRRSNGSGEVEEELTPESKKAYDAWLKLPSIDEMNAELGRRNSTQGGHSGKEVAIDKDNQGERGRPRIDYSKMSDEELLKPDAKFEALPIITEDAKSNVVTKAGSESKEPYSIEEANARIEEQRAQRFFQQMSIRRLLEKLAWADVSKELLAQKEKCITGKGRVAFRIEQKKVEYMEFMQNVLVRNLKGHVFRGKLKGTTVVDVDENRLVLTRKSVQDNSTQTITWQKFYKDYPGNLNEVINSYIVNGRTNGRLNLGAWRKSMLGAALTIQMICGDVIGAKERSVALVKEVAMQRYTSELKELFSDEEFDGEVTDSKRQVENVEVIPGDPRESYAKSVVKDFNFNIASHFIIHPNLRAQVSKMFVADEFWKAASQAKVKGNVLGVLNALSERKFETYPESSEVDAIFKRLRQRQLHIAMTFSNKQAYHNIKCFRIVRGYDGLADAEDVSSEDQIDDFQIVVKTSIRDGKTYMMLWHDYSAMTSSFYGTNGYKSKFRILEKKLENRLISKDEYNREVEALNRGIVEFVNKTMMGLK